MFRVKGRAIRVQGLRFRVKGSYGLMFRATPTASVLLLKLNEKVPVPIYVIPSGL